MANLLTNEKETKRAIKAAVDQANKVKTPLYIECVICGCMPKPAEWSSVAKNCCYDCA